jgi:hypothetical protein
MKKCWKNLGILPYVGLLILFNAAWGFAEDLGPVKNIHAVTGHEINHPSQETIIEMVWSLPEGYSQESIEGYYCRFDTLSDSEFDDFNDMNTIGMELLKNQTAISQDYASLEPDDLYIFFHIAAVTLDDEDEPIISPTETVGPFRIDIISPINVWVSGPDETSSRNVTLALGSESTNIEIYISNIEYGEFGSGWIPFVISKDWVLTEGEGLKSIYVEFRDDAGNISKASTQITYKTTDPVSAIHSCGNYLPGTEITINNSMAYTGTFDFIHYLMEIPDGWVMESTSINDENYTVLENNNIEFEWTSLETAGENMPFTCSLSVPYGQSGEKQIQSLVTYQMDGNTPINEYALPDPLFIPQRLIYYSVLSQAGDNGSVSPESLTVAHGDTIIFEIQPDEGYEIDQFSVNGIVQVLDGHSYTINHVVEDIKLNVSFKRIELSIVVNAGDHGSVEPGSKTVYYNESVSFQITPERGYKIGTVTLNSIPVSLTGNVLNIPSIKSDQTLEVNFDKIPEVITSTHETDPFFIPGQLMNMNLNIEFTGFLTALGFEVQLPDNFVYKSMTIHEGTEPEIQYNSKTNMLSLAWVDLETQNISVTYQLAPPDDITHPVDILGKLKYRFTDQSEVALPNDIGTQPVLLIGNHQYISGPYTGGEAVTISNAIEYTGNMTGLNMSVTLPEGWTYLGSNGINLPDTVPQIDATGDIAFQWNTLPESISFEYSIKPAESSTGTVDIQSILSAQHNGIVVSAPLMPEQLFIEQSYVTATHDASETYVANIPYVVTNQIDYNGDISALQYKVAIPVGWQYSQSSGADVPGVYTFTQGEINFSWDTIPQSPVNFAYILIPDAYTETEKSISATVYYQRMGDMKSVNASPEKIIATSGLFVVTHSVQSVQPGETNWYTPGQKITIACQIQYSEKYINEITNPFRLTSLGYRINLPSGWTYVSNSSNFINKEVDYGLELTWTSKPPPDSPVNFSCTIQVPETATGLAKISSLAVYRIGDESNGENVEAAYPDPLLIYNALKPTVTIESRETSPTNNDSIPMTATFSKPIMGFQASDIEVTNATITQFSGQNYIYSFILIPNQDGLITLNIPENVVTDSQGKGNEASEMLNILVDRTAPTVSISSDIPEFARTSPWLLTINFSESVLNFDMSKIYMDQATGISLNKENEQTFILSLSPVDQGEVTIYVPQNSVSDAAGNANIQSNTHIRTFDTEPPTITLKTLNGAEDITIEVYEPFNDPGATAYDLIDGDISDQIQVDDPVDTSQANTYYVIYSVNDRAGNMAIISRTVIVQPDQVTPTVQIETGGGFLPANDYIISATIRFKQGLSTMGYECVLPTNWKFGSVWGDNVPDVIRFDEKTQILGFAWSEGISGLDKISFSYVVEVPEDVNSYYSIPAEILYRYSDQGEKKVSASFTIEEQSVVATHSSKDIYIPEKPVSIDVDIHLDKVSDIFNTFSAVGLVVQLPDNWVYDCAYGNGAPVSSASGIAPEKGASGTLQFAWFNISENKINFTYDVIPPADATNTAQITAYIKYRFSNGIERTVQLIPSELEFEPASMLISHSGDPIFIPGNPQTIKTDIIYNGSAETMSNMRLSVNVPDGWDITNISGLNPPTIEQTNILKWEQVPSSPIIFTYDLIPNDKNNTVNISAELSYERFGEQFTQKANPDYIQMTMGDIQAQHSMVLPALAGTYFYTPGDIVQIDNKITFTGSYQSLTYTVTKPENWSYEGSNVENWKLSGHNIVFNFSGNLSSPVTFSYMLSVPETDSGERTISAELTYDASQSIPAYPETLVAFDNLSPEPTISHDLGSITAASPLNLTLVFSKPVYGLEKSDFTIENATFDHLNKMNDATYVIVLSPINQGEVVISLDENKASDAFGSGNKKLERISIEYDSLPPEVASIVSPVKSITNEREITVTVNLSDDVTNFSKESVSIINGTIKEGSLSGSGKKFIFTIIPENQGEIIISIDKGKLADAAGNRNQNKAELSLTYDSISPVILLSTDVLSFTMTQDVALDIKFQESVVSELVEDDINIVNGSVKSLTEKSLTETSLQTYAAIITPDSCGYMTINIPGGIFYDEAGNVNAASNSIELIFNCQTFSGQVIDSNNNALADVNVSIVFPEKLDVQASKTNGEGNYTITAPAPEPMTYYFTLAKSGYVFENLTFLSGQSDEFEITLATQKMKHIAEMNFGYTISGTVLADSQPISSVLKTPIAKVFTIHPDETEAQSTVASNDGNFVIGFGFDNIPSTPFEIVASMGDYYTIINLETVPNQAITLNMSKLKIKKEVEVSVSADFGAEVKVQTESGEDAAAIEIQPRAIADSSRVEMKVHKASDKLKSILKSEVVEINLKKADDTKAAINTYVIARLNISDDTFFDIQKIFDGDYRILYADDYDDFEAGEMYYIPEADIFPIINPEQRFIKFKVRHFTVFGIGQQPETEILPRLKDENAGQRRCFISTIQSISFNPMLIIFGLTILIGLLRKQISHH